MPVEGHNGCCAHMWSPESNFRQFLLLLGNVFIKQPSLEAEPLTEPEIYQPANLWDLPASASFMLGSNTNT